MTECNTLNVSISRNFRLKSHKLKAGIRNGAEVTFIKFCW